MRCCLKDTKMECTVPVWSPVVRTYIELCTISQPVIQSYPVCMKIVKKFTSTFNTKKVSLVQVSSCSNTELIRNYPYCTSRQNSLELTELSCVNKVSLVQVSSCSNAGSVRDDSYRTSRKYSSELIELFSINKVSLVQVFPVVTLDQ